VFYFVSTFLYLFIIRKVSTHTTLANDVKKVKTSFTFILHNKLFFVTNIQICIDHNFVSCIGNPLRK